MEAATATAGSASASGSLHYAFRQLYLKYEDTVIAELRQEWPPALASNPQQSSSGAAASTSAAESPSFSPPPETAPPSSPAPAPPPLPPNFGAFQLDGSLHYSLFGVFDGHCGGELARHCA